MESKDWISLDVAILFGLVSAVLAWIQVQQGKPGRAILKEGDNVIVRRLFRFDLLRPTHYRKFVICTDSRFIDSSIFLLAAERAAHRLKSTDLVLAHREWSRVPSYVAEVSNAIGYFNRRSSYTSLEPSAIESWGNLCFYKGYAILGRTSRIAASPTSIEESNRVLDRLLSEAAGRGRRLVIMTMGVDAIWRFASPLLFNFDITRCEIREDDVESAADRFLGGEGDLFIGGLPQRLRCMESGKCVEIVTSEYDPTLFAVNSMIVKSSDVETVRDVLNAIFDEWGKLTRELEAGDSAVDALFEYYVRTTSALGAGRFRSNSSMFHHVLSESRGYLKFFSSLSDSSAELIVIQKKALKLALELDLPLKEVDRLMTSIFETFDATHH